uniref:Uncharacterized protein n=1 Tax=Pseudo-nitzschia australis TaxID=44445 RepID=A0A7S4A9J1_9STRA|mmetsp:Transcript_17114/g.37438  ORF Transcript_17114/g.37438 Transcript_17114/m.37438 type:complete len:161 (+) Transcript_17114:101-583(+)
MKCHGIISSSYTVFIFVISSLTITLCAVDSLQLNFDNRVRIQPSPLIGGPDWLPVHCKVVVDDSYVFDFIPLNAASPETLQKLISLQAVPATVRTRQKNHKREAQETEHQNSENKSDNEEVKKIYIERADQFCKEYDRDLHLINNNCWSFAFDLIQYISR